MTVRVNKSSFNIREKLSELERPIGLKGSELMRAETAQDARDLVSAGRKNKIINGDMRIDQRNDGSSVTPTNSSFSLDRWKHEVSQTSKFTVQQSSVAPFGFSTSMLVTSSSAYSVGSSDYFDVFQWVEGFNWEDMMYGSSDARTATLSFWVRSSLTGTFGGSITNSTQIYSYPFEYEVSSADTWEYKTVTFSGATAGSWLESTNRGVGVFFGLGMGSTFSGTAGSWSANQYYSSTGATSVVGTNGATWYITGVQLEVGRNATEFEHRSYGEELALCQRYFLKSNNAEGSVYESGGSSANVGLGMAFPVEMRTTPSVVFGSTTNNVHNYGGGDNSYSGQNAIYMTSKGARMYFTGGTSKTVGTFSVLLNEASFSAEL